jgi:glycosyltransferase involved in cell wall biosynthesis
MMLFSILIPTLYSRKHLLQKMLHALEEQHRASGLLEYVEIRTLADGGELTIGEKRNRMVSEARGKYVAFVDDDDQVSDTYIRDVVWALRANPGVDCVGFWGKVFFQGQFGGNMIHSLCVPVWTEKPGWYYRHPNHLNPIKQSVAASVQYQPIRWSEDHFWCHDLARSGGLKSEVFLGHKPLYIYLCREARKGL